jgi:hypothetical protein
MSDAPNTEQINAALSRAADAARERTPYPERLLRHLQRPPERIDERWWLIGHIRVLGQPERWDVLYDPETDVFKPREKRPNVLRGRIVMELALCGVLRGGFEERGDGSNQVRVGFRFGVVLCRLLAAVDEEVEGDGEPARVGADWLVNVGRTKAVAPARRVVARADELQDPATDVDEAAVALDPVDGYGTPPPAVVVRRRCLAGAQAYGRERPARQVFVEEATTVGSPGAAPIPINPTGDGLDRLQNVGAHRRRSLVQVAQAVEVRGEVGQRRSFFLGAPRVAKGSGGQAQRVQGSCDDLTAGRDIPRE